LETTLPDEAARQEILADHLSKLPVQLRLADVKHVAAETEGLTGADLRRLVEDGKILYAYDKSKNRATDDILGYFKKAIETIRSNKQKYMEAEEKSRMKNAIPDPFAFMRRQRDFNTEDDTPA